MYKHILVAYGSRFGSTAEVADAIGMCLEQIGAFADVVPVDEVRSLDGYDAAVLGSAIRGGAWLPEVFRFLDTQHMALSRLPVAYFTLCMTLRENTAESHRVVASYLEPLLRDFPQIRPVSTGMFAGALDPDSLRPMARLMAEAVEFPSGDFRDWGEICKWAQGLLPLLSAEPHAARKSDP